jgi:hypothetical protein
VTRFRRQTRDSIIPGNFLPPYTIDRIIMRVTGVGHGAARIEGACAITTCCGGCFNLPNPANVLAGIATCVLCVNCRGCPACREGWVREETMRLGKWVTKDGRMLYPFEMDSVHLTNSIRKLKRDKTHFKQAWETWVEILEAEAKQRALDW